MQMKITSKNICVQQLFTEPLDSFLTNKSSGGGVKLKVERELRFLYLYRIYRPDVYKSFKIRQKLAISFKHENQSK